MSFHHHELVGARMTRDRMRALRYPVDDIDRVSRLVELHLRSHTYAMGWTDSAVRRYVRDAGDLLEDLNELTRADCTTRNPARAQALSRRMDELEARICGASRKRAAGLHPPRDPGQSWRTSGFPPAHSWGERSLTCRSSASRRAHILRKRPPTVRRVVGRAARIRDPVAHTSGAA